ncbi:MAG TPA: MBL fold metallo-hydrolase [Planctomycetota bacterium]|nr:MBL fold metallo-hydrolase [Planctomycetota bacterium]
MTPDAIVGVEPPPTRRARSSEAATRGATTDRWRIWYDDQCELCHAGLAWLRVLDRHGRVEAIPLSAVVGGGEPRPGDASDDDLLRHIHAQAPDGSIHVGSRAMARLACLFPWTAPIGWLARAPGFAWIAAALYGWVARNRYSLSRCRGGACRSVDADLVKRKASWRAFQACRAMGGIAIAPLAAALYVSRLARQIARWARTRDRSATLLDGRLSIHVLGGGVSATVPVLFGELFTMTRYRSALVDPGGTHMRRSMARHLRRLGPSVSVEHVLATHAHEEHCGNLEAASAATGAAIRAHSRAVPLLRSPERIPFLRSFVIGQPKPVARPVAALDGSLRIGPERDAVIEVIETPGHCSDHVSFYSAADRLLLVGDGFMGTHFTSPNDDVDHRAWIASLERMLALDVEILVEAHGHVHSLRDDVHRDLARAGLASLGSRRSPRELLVRKLDFLRWVAEQVEAGRAEGLPASGIQATVFPWTQRWSYESAIQDALAAAVSGRAFGRHKVVRTFRAPDESGETLPLVYEVRLAPTAAR